MPKRQTRGYKSKGQRSDVLKGWQQIAAFLGEPASVVRRWASDGMDECLSEYMAEHPAPK